MIPEYQTELKIKYKNKETSISSVKINGCIIGIKRKVKINFQVFLDRRPRINI